MKKFLLAGTALLVLCSSAKAQVICCGTSSGYITLQPGQSYACNNGQCNTAPNEGTLARWAADRAVAGQLESKFPNEKAVGKLDRAELDALATRLDALSKWAAGLSNHILRDAYCNWVRIEQSYVDSRRETLDKLDVAKGLITRLPALPAGN